MVDHEYGVSSLYPVASTTPGGLPPGDPGPLLGSDVVEWRSNSVPLVHETAPVRLRGFGYVDPGLAGIINGKRVEKVSVDSGI